MIGEGWSYFYCCVTYLKGQATKNNKHSKWIAGCSFFTVKVPFWNLICPIVTSPFCSSTKGESWFVAYLISLCFPDFSSKYNKECFLVCLPGIVRVKGEFPPLKKYTLSFISQLGPVGK